MRVHSIHECEEFSVCPQHCSGPRTVEVLEPFTFRDGAVRLAWVTWIIGDVERRCVAVREV